jgi:hypothetical protein
VQILHQRFLLREGEVAARLAGGAHAMHQRRRFVLHFGAEVLG